MMNLPLLILANKQDLNFAMDPEEIADILNLSMINDRQWTILACSAKTKMGKFYFNIRTSGWFSMDH